MVLCLCFSFCILRSSSGMLSVSLDCLFLIATFISSTFVLSTAISSYLFSIRIDASKDYDDTLTMSAASVVCILRYDKV